MIRKLAIYLLGGLAILNAAAVANAETRIHKEFGKWLVTCSKPDGEQNNCALSQTFQGVNQKTRKRVFVFSWIVSADGEGMENATLRTPLGVDLEKRMNVIFPGSKPVSVGYDVCNRRGCFGEFAFDVSWSRALQRSETVEIKYSFRGGRDVLLDAELEGFDEAYAFYKEQMAQ